MKIAFFDVDGTLLPLGQTGMLPGTVKALKELQNKGIKICIATGRPLIGVPKFQEVTFDMILCFNGSLCMMGDEVILKKPIPHEDVVKIIENAAGIGRAVALATLDTVESNGSDPDLVEYFSKASEIVHVSDRFESLVQEDVYQIMASCNEEERKIILHGSGNVRATAWWPKAVDIIPADSGKGPAIL